MILLLKSIIIGICAILPGVSGSVIAVTLGIYYKFIDIICDFNKIKKNYKFLLIVSIGVILGIYFASNLIMYIFKFKTIIYYILIGIILSEIPFLVKNIHVNTNKRVMIIPLLSSFLLSIILDKLNTSSNLIMYSSFKYFIGGIFFSFGKVFPGVSSSFFLLCLGIYENIIILVNNPFLLIKNFWLYFPFIIGTIIGLIIFIKLLSFLMKNYYRFIYSLLLGFIISSVYVLIPDFSFNFINITGILLMIFSFIIMIIIKLKQQ